MHCIRSSPPPEPPSVGPPAVTQPRRRPRYMAWKFMVHEAEQEPAVMIRTHGYFLRPNNNQDLNVNMHKVAKGR